MKVIATLVAALACTAAHAEFQTGSSLLGLMRQADVSRYTAFGYLMGVHDLGRGTVHCSPESMRGGALAKLVLDFLVANEGDGRVLSQSADVIVSGVLQAAYPCPSRPGL